MQVRGGTRVGKGKKGGSEGKEEKREREEGKGEGKTGSGKGILAIPILFASGAADNLFFSLVKLPEFVE